MLLPPLKDPLPPPLAARGRAILGMLDEVSHDEALDLAVESWWASSSQSVPRSRNPLKIKPATT